MKSARKIPIIKYNQPNEHFYYRLKERVFEYLEKHGGRNANMEMHIKAVVMVSGSVGLYALILSNWFAGWKLTLLQCIFHPWLFLTWIGIVHDALHNAYSRSRVVNQRLTLIGDLVGIASYVIRYNHVKAHHSAVNIPEHDIAIEPFGVIRLHPNVAQKWFHKYQHIYVWFLYGIGTMFKVFAFDTLSLFKKNIGAFPFHKHHPKNLIITILCKVITISYLLVIPMSVLDASKSFYLFGFILGNFLSGLLLAFIFQVTHICQCSKFTMPDYKEYIDNSFALHILDNTSSFSTSSWFMNHLCGGLNHHVIHHIFPSICHIHYPKLTLILKETCEEFGLPFKQYPTLWSALASHYKTMKKLGTSAISIA